MFTVSLVKGRLSEVQKMICNEAKASTTGEREEELFLFGVLLLKPLDPTLGVDDFLRARKEGVASRADVQPYVFFSGSGLDHRSACTGDGCLFVLRMNTFLHGTLLPFPKDSRGL
jgi:hypothetical protein